MPRHTEQRHLPYTPEQLFDLVADVNSYQDFLPWVAAVRIRSDSETETVADLVVGFRALKETFTSKVHKCRPHEIEIDYVEGPLKYLHNTWKFRPDGQGGTDRRFLRRLRLSQPDLRDDGRADVRSGAAADDRRVRGPRPCPLRHRCVREQQLERAKRRLKANAGAAEVAELLACRR